MELQVFEIFEDRKGEGVLGSIDLDERIDPHAPKEAGHGGILPASPLAEVMKWSILIPGNFRSC